MSKIENALPAKSFKKMNNYYGTFGQVHIHKIDKVTFDKDCVVEIKAEDEEKAREYMFAVFGQKWAFLYKEKPDMEYFPRGIFKIK